MLLQPQRLEFKKSQKRYKKHKGRVTRARAHRLVFGLYGLKALENNNITASNIEATRRVIIRHLRKIGKI